MPELPEVETARRLATRVAVGRRITEVWCAPDPIVYEGVSAGARARRPASAAASARRAGTASTSGSSSTARRRS